MKNSRLKNLALGAGLGLLVAFGGGVTSGCATDEVMVTSKQFSVLKREYNISVSEMNKLYREYGMSAEEQIKWAKSGKPPLEEYLKQSKSQYEQELKAREDALKAQESKKSY